MNFIESKKSVLSRKDKSQQGIIDKQIVKLINIINSNKDYCTTSSCAGRTQLILQKSEKKNDSEWIFKSHDYFTFQEINKILKKGFTKGELWFRQEGLILHIRCKTLDSANKLIDISRRSGFKRAGLFQSTSKITVEITSTEKLDTIIGVNSKLYINQEYLKLLVKTANKKMKKNFKKIEKLISLLSAQQLLL